MKSLLLLIPGLIILASCSRPETPPPTTPVKPPTVETTAPADSAATPHN